jgi:NifU-like protein involved in Fe-S cluster formation
MVNSMSEQLYNTRILRLAAHIPYQARLPAPQVSVQKHSAICGSRVTVDVVMQQGRVALFGQEVRACALGQASASILGAQIIGRTADELAQTAQMLRDFLQNGGPAPQMPFGELEIFAPAIPHRARHASIMICFEAAAEAAAKASV